MSKFSELPNGIATNEQGLAMVWNLKNVCPDK